MSCISSSELDRGYRKLIYREHSPSHDHRRDLQLCCIRFYRSHARHSIRRAIRRYLVRSTFSLSLSHHPLSPTYTFSNSMQRHSVLDLPERAPHLLWQNRLRSLHPRRDNHRLERSLHTNRIHNQSFPKTLPSSGVLGIWKYRHSRQCWIGLLRSAQIW